MTSFVFAPVFAHGAVGPTTLPIPKWAGGWSGSAALVILFMLLYVMWPVPRFERAAVGKVLGSFTRYLHDAVVILLRAVGLVAFVVTLIALWFGSLNSAQNIAPTLIYVTFWVGVSLLSLIVGDLWQALSPFDTLAALAGAARDKVWRRTPEPLADDGTFVTSYWPAVAGLVAFMWLELCYHGHYDIRRLALLVTIYSVIILAATARYGRAWLRTGEAFSAYFGLFAQMAPVTVDRDTHRIRLRKPFSALSTLSTRPGITMLIVAGLGGTTFDGISRTTFWQKVLGSSTGWNYTFINTFGLIWIIGMVGIVYAIAATTAAWITDADRYDAPAFYLGALLPIAYTYTFAHYFTYLVFEGQDVVRLLSDPFGQGWNLFGTIYYVINFNVISITTVAWTKIIAIIVGHIIALTVVHDRAIEDDYEAARSQIPMLVMMIAFLSAGMVLLLP